MPYGISNTSGQVPEAEIKTILELALAAGIDILDTASAYGSSEEVLGHAGVYDWRVVTKLPSVPPGCTDAYRWAKQQVRQSLLRLQIETAYGMLVHNPNDLLGPHSANLIRALRELKDEGIVTKIGITIYDPESLPSLSSQLTLDIVQAPFNVVDRRLYSSGWLRRLKRCGTEIHVRSAFLQGLLLTPHPERPLKFSRWDWLWEQWQSWLDTTEQSAASACLGFLSSFSDIDRIVIGVDGVRQFKELLDLDITAFLSPPSILQSDDIDLIDPSRWEQL